MTERAEVVVVGGGVVGLACARELLERGRSVRVLEAGRVGAGASHGNCGLVTPSHALPLTRPGMVRQVLRWMTRADSPVYVRPRLDLSLVGWGLRFARHCTARGMGAALAGRAALLESSRELFVEWVERDGLACEWEPGGLLEVFATEGAAAEGEGARRLLEEHGVRSEALDADALRKLEPALRDDLFGARLWPRDAQVRPERLVAELARVVRERGGTIQEGVGVVDVETERGRVRGVVTDSTRVPAREVVLAAGAWSPTLGRRLGLKLPIQPGKGYSITSARPDPCPRLPLLLAETSMAVTPWPSGFRLGGTMELSGPNHVLRSVRLEALRRGAARFLRTPIGPGAQEEWCGWRPMTPDELPVVGPAPRVEGLFVAAGHGMMGVSMAPATARLVGELVEGRTPFLDPRPYRVDRF